jgi:threonine/homoserine/homoserine lactone efflux protein
MEIILKGVISGLVLALMIGPVFFTILQTSIERGFNKGVLVAIGVSLSDMLYIIISYLGLSQIIHNDRVKIYLTYGGGLMLLGFGCYYLFIKSKKLAEVDPKLIKPRSPWRYIAKGFIINGLTPMMLIFWIGTVSVATTDLGYHAPREAFLFFSGIVCTVFITDVIKAKLADQLRHLLTSRLIHILNITLGIVLIGFGLRLLFFTSQIW